MHYLDMVGVTGSIPVAPTIKINDLQRIPGLRSVASKHIASNVEGAHEMASCEV